MYILEAEKLNLTLSDDKAFSMIEDVHHKKLRIAYDTIKEVYPDAELQVHMHSEYRRNDESGMILPMFVVKFDRIEITNTRNHNHIIKDLFVYILFTQEFGIVVKGTRASLSEPEIHSTYLHSHLPSLKVPNKGIRTFCLGNDTFRASIMRTNASFTKSNFKMFLFQLNDYVRWESLDGGPYRKINDINFRKVKYSIDITYNIKKDIIKYIDNHFYTDDFNISSGSTIQVMDDDVFITALNKLLPDIYKCTTDESGVEYMLQNSDKELDNTLNIVSNVIWKQKKVPFKVIMQEYIVKKDDRSGVSKIIRNFVINYLENKIKEKLVG